jgi:hypothetical protein
MSIISVVAAAPTCMLNWTATLRFAKRITLIWDVAISNSPRYQAREIG